MSAAAEAWFAARGWLPFAFQREVWAAMAAGDSGLLHATTGSGKTYAVWMGALARARAGPGLQVLWITPMRALAADTTRALQLPVAELAPAFTVGQRQLQRARGVGGQRAHRRDPQHLQPRPGPGTGQRAHPHRIGLAAAGGGMQQAAAALAHRRPDLALEVEYRPAALLEPGLHGSFQVGRRRVQGDHRQNGLPRYRYTAVVPWLA